jgi:AcrR family transcriptional regulator
MSSKPVPLVQKTDPRILRTRDRLGDALVELMLAKPFDSITVQDVLDRAGVGRSTFYTHYRDKEDLFFSDVEDFFQVMSTLVLRRNEVSDRVAPVRELFAHLADAQAFHSALVASGKIHEVLELGKGHFARAIELRLAAIERTRGIAAPERTVVSQAFAGALMSLLSWWIDRGMTETPERMDELYHRMFWSGVGAS